MEVDLYTDGNEPQLINHQIFTRVCEEWGVQRQVCPPFSVFVKNPDISCQNTFCLKARLGSWVSGQKRHQEQNYMRNIIY